MENIGLVTYWHPSGQATVMRDLKDILDNSGKYKAHVLSRRSKFILDTDDWPKDNLTIGSEFLNIPFQVYKKWIIKNNIKKIIFFQNYQFDFIKKIRDMGVKTYGTFMWERLRADSAKQAKEVYTKIFSLHPAEVVHYKEKFDIDSQYISWGIPPRMLERYQPNQFSGPITFFFPVGKFDARRNYMEVIRAFKQVKNKNARLFIYSKGNSARVAKIISTDPRIVLGSSEVVKSDDDFFKYMNDADVFILPSKWEGLGLSFYEAMAIRRPIITVDSPPMNNHIIKGKIGVAVPAVIEGYKPGMIPKINFKEKDMTKAIENMCNYKIIKKMSSNIEDILKTKYSWQKTKRDVLKLLS